MDSVDFASHMRASGIGVVASDAYGRGASMEAARVCLGGPVSREALSSALAFMAHALESAPEMASTFL